MLRIEARVKDGQNHEHKSLQNLGISKWNCSIEDLNEYEVIIRCFGETSELKINSSKSMLGHLVGASGVVEAIATVKVKNKQEKDKIGTKPDQIKKKQEA
uniref:beta-ketoacyl-[acyl-carrier-protein] synthase I n=1 Tax=Tanacetum cinerariifolium TaxID=118510 RepID=A0A6L2JUV6_TANCI|nr:3-oxoacyl-[acyl-carrier-protein] synthase II, chloroplastic-like [Tanacetum cinerariifolium]